MSGLIARRLVLGMFVTLILVFSLQSIGNTLVSDIIVSQMIEPSRSESSGEDDAVPVAVIYDIAISEIMYATNTDKLPQWIELHNRSRGKVSLEGWEVTIMNHPEDRSVLATTIIITLGAKILNANQVLLFVTEQGHNSGVGEAKGDLQPDRVVILKDLIEGTPGYRLLSQTAFKVILKAPTRTKTDRKMLSDIVGNLGAIPEWKLPRIEGNQRSSIIREYEGGTDMPYDGTRSNGWELSSKKDRRYTPQTTYYGHHTDYGAPGYRVYGPLPVSLSSFRPVRDKATGEVVVRWVTKSELNNAGFNILRSQIKKGEFKIINVKGLIVGRGTTNEPHEYVFTDTTAKRNIVYYYRIECVSVEGKHTTLGTTHLRGYIDYHLKSFRHLEQFWWRFIK